MKAYGWDAEELIAQDEQSGILTGPRQQPIQDHLCIHAGLTTALSCCCPATSSGSLPGLV